MHMKNNKKHTINQLQEVQKQGKPNLFNNVSSAVKKQGKQTGLYVEIKCQLDATEVFIADLIACSTCFGHHYVHHHELKSIIQWLLPVVLFKLLVWCGTEGYVSGLQDTAASCKPDT